MTDQHGGDLYWTEQNAYWMVLVCDSCLDYITGPRHAWDMGNNPDHGHDMIRERQTVMMVHADKLLDYHSINGRHATGIKYNFPIKFHSPLGMRHTPAQVVSSCC